MLLTLDSISNVFECKSLRTHPIETKIQWESSSFFILQVWGDNTNVLLPEIYANTKIVGFFLFSFQQDGLGPASGDIEDVRNEEGGVGVGITRLAFLR